MRDLKAIGANVTAKGESQVASARSVKGLGGKSALQTVRDSYEHFRQDTVLPATYEVIYGHAWKPQSVDGKKQGSTELLVDFQR